MDDLGIDTNLDPRLVATTLAIARAEPPGMGFDIPALPKNPKAHPQEHLLATSARTQPDTATANKPE